MDALLEGGVETGCISMFYGEAGTGKSTLCLILARNIAMQGKKVAYIDTEGVSMDRLRQICGDDFDAVVKKILFFAVNSFEEQERTVDKAIKLAEGNLDIGMIIVDSISMHYRLTSRMDDSRERKDLAAQTTKLTALSRTKDLPVVLTSQVYTDIETGEFLALGGHVLHHNAKLIIRLDKVSPGLRRAVLIKHRSMPEGLTADFRLTANGISCQL